MNVARFLLSCLSRILLLFRRDMDVFRRASCYARRPHSLHHSFDKQGGALIIAWQQSRSPNRPLSRAARRAAYPGIASLRHRHRVATG